MLRAVDPCSLFNKGTGFPTVSPTEFFALYKKAMRLFYPNTHGIGFVHSHLGFRPILKPRVNITQYGSQLLIELFSVSPGIESKRVFTGAWRTRDIAQALYICTRSSVIHCLISTGAPIVSSLWISGINSDARENFLRGEAVYHQPKALGSLGFSVPITDTQFQPMSASTLPRAEKLSLAVHSVGISLPDTECGAAS